ncbi:hypothetical protein ANCDUO_17670, partial [Ancylostoma duodenale]
LVFSIAPPQVVSRSQHDPDAVIQLIRRFAERHLIELLLGQCCAIYFYFMISFEVHLAVQFVPLSTEN